MSAFRTFQLAITVPLFASLLNAQPAPVPGEAELRERVQTFYQLQMDKKFRQAEAFVAEDTKDFYYSSSKGAFDAFKISKIEILEPGKKAKVTVRSNFTVMMMGAPKPMPMEMPFSSTWKVEEGKWVMYVDQKAPVPTPFGDFKRDAAPTGGPAGLPKMPAISDMNNLIKADKTSIVLTEAEPVQTVTLINSLPGVVDFKLDASGIPRATVEAEGTKLPASGTVKIKISRKLPGVSQGMIQVDVPQLGIGIHIQVLIQ